MYPVSMGFPQSLGSPVPAAFLTRSNDQRRLFGEVKESRDRGNMAGLTLVNLDVANWKITILEGKINCQ